MARVLQGSRETDLFITVYHRVSCNNGSSCKEHFNDCCYRRHKPQSSIIFNFYDAFLLSK